MININSNGSEGANNSSNETQENFSVRNIGSETTGDGGKGCIGVNAKPDNIRYCPILCKYFGISKVNADVTADSDEEQYVFNYANPSYTRLVKIFTEINREEMMRYAMMPVDAELIFIIDTKRLPRKEWENLSGPIGIPMGAMIAAANIDAYILHEGHLIEFVGDLESGKWAWCSVFPVYPEVDEGDMIIMNLVSQ